MKSSPKFFLNLMYERTLLNSACNQYESVGHKRKSACNKYDSAGHKHKSACNKYESAGHKRNSACKNSSITIRDPL